MMTGIKAGRYMMVLLLASLLAAAFLGAGCNTSIITLAATRDTAQSKMYMKLIKEFENKNNITVKTESFDNTAEVLQAGAKGQADALLVSNKTTVDEWMKKGYALSASDVFYSDFIVVGPDADPAQIRGLDCPGKSCKKIGTAGAAFVACGDGSDLDTKVMGYWSKCGVDPAGQAWFTKTGNDVAATLKTASDKQAYTICDMSTWLENQKDVSLTKLVEGCAMLLNQYSLVVINSKKFTDEKLNAEGSAKLVKFMTGKTGQGMVGAYKESGVVIFHPNATKQADGQAMNM